MPRGPSCLFAKRPRSCLSTFSISSGGAPLKRIAGDMRVRSGGGRRHPYVDHLACVLLDGQRWALLPPGDPIAAHVFTPATWSGRMPLEFIDRIIRRAERKTITGLSDVHSRRLEDRDEHQTP